MRLIFYSKTATQYSVELIEKIAESFPSDRIGICRNQVSLRAALLEPASNLWAMVLICSDPTDLLNLIAMRELMYRTAVILVLPDWNPETVAKGHTLRPRLLAWPGLASGEIVAVLQRVQEKVEKFNLIRGRSQDHG